MTMNINMDKMNIHMDIKEDIININMDINMDAKTD